MAGNGVAVIRGARTRGATRLLCASGWSVVRFGLECLGGLTNGGATDVDG